MFRQNSEKYWKYENLIRQIELNRKKLNQDYIQLKKSIKLKKYEPTELIKSISLINSKLSNFVKMDFLQFFGNNQKRFIFKYKIRNFKTITEKNSGYLSSPIQSLYFHDFNPLTYSLSQTIINYI